jgi:CRP-like cAMP-binding protein
VQQQQFSGLIQKSPQVAVKIITQFSKRLRYLNQTLVQNTVKSTTEENFSQLFNAAEYYFAQDQFDKAYYVFNAYLKNDPSGEKIAAAKERLAEIAKTASVQRSESLAEKTIRSYKKNTMIFVDGEPGDELFIIQSGSINISKIIGGNEVILATLKAGDILGEMALLEDKPRGASAVAYEDCTVMAVGRANFKQMIVTHPQIIVKVTTVLAERIWFIYKQLANTMLDEPLARIFDTLYIQLEKDKVEIDSLTPHVFAFGQSELAKMVGLSQEDAVPILAKLFENKFIKILDGKISTTSTSEIAKQTDFYRRMDKRNKNQEENRK